MRSEHRTITRVWVALVMAVCLLFSTLAPAGAATVSAGSTSSSLTPSATKVYIKLSKSVLFFTGDLYGNGSTVTPTLGAVCQLYTDDFYTGSDGLTYFSVYYMNTRYNVLRTDVLNDVMSAGELETYITGTLWKQASYTTLKESMNLVGDVRVHALQLALQKLGYYNDKLDGNYGDNTTKAVKQFQRANGLQADGAAGVLTQPVIYTLASGGTVSGGGSSGSSSGGSSSGSSISSGTSTSKSSAISPQAGTLCGDPSQGSGSSSGSSANASSSSSSSWDAARQRRARSSSAANLSNRSQLRKASRVFHFFGSKQASGSNMANAPFPRRLRDAFRIAEELSHKPDRSTLSRRAGEGALITCSNLCRPR